MECKHNNFKATVNVIRLKDSDKFQADIRIECSDCVVPMRFLGLPVGIHLNGATVSVDACEARLAIAPEDEVIPALEGGCGLSVRRAK